MGVVEMVLMKDQFSVQEKRIIEEVSEDKMMHHHPSHPIKWNGLICLLGSGGHYADVWFVDGFLRNLQRAATVRVTVFFTPLRHIEVFVSEAAKLTLKHRPNLPLELVYHL